MFTKLNLRKATEQDLTDIVNLLNDDFLGKNREDLNCFNAYIDAFNEIQNYNNIQLLVLENENKKIIGTMQLIMIPCIAVTGSKRMEIEAVRIASELRGSGIGSWMIKESIKIAKQHNCKIVQLSSNNQRIDAHKFYEKLGFDNSHVGMKLEI